MSSETDNKALLAQLRIDRSAPVADERPSRRPWIIAAAAGVAAVAAVGWWLAHAPPALPVHTQPARAVSAAGGANASVLDATGYVTARREATVSAQITGTVTEVLIEEGEHVDAGYVLATLDGRHRADRQPAQPGAGARAAGAARQHARPSSTQADADCTRYAGSGRAQAGFASRRWSRRAPRSKPGRAARSRAAQSIRRGRTCSRAQGQSDYCTVRAPFTGVIIAKAAQVGEIVSPLSAGGGFTRTGIGTIVDMDSLEVEVDVNEAYIGRVQPKQPVESVLNAYPDWKIPSHVIAIIPTADRCKATVKVRIALERARTRASCRTWACGCPSSRSRSPRSRAAAPRACWCRRRRSRTDGDDARLRAEGRKVQRAHGDARPARSATRARSSTGVVAGETIVISIRRRELKDDGARSRVRSR